MHVPEGDPGSPNDGMPLVMRRRSPYGLANHQVINALTGDLVKVFWG